MKKILLLLLFIQFSIVALAGKIYGLITNSTGDILSYASVSIKGTTRGTTANSEGKYFLNLSPGSYTLVCQYVGYKREEKNITVTAEDQEINFTLTLQEFILKEVIVKKGEDPAYEIIRQAIKKRPYYQDQLDKFQCEVYTKGQLKLRDYPTKILGQKVDFEDGDTSKKKMVYLSETVARYSVEQPGKAKVEVLSTKVSGQSDGFGLAAPQIYSFYDNNVSIGNENFGPRGFISPISNNALNYYRYKYEGAFFEDGKQISRIKVTPKRKYEPLFSGHINIVEDDWRIHSLQLQLTKESQMEIIDTLRLEQLYMPYSGDVWVMKSQVMYPAIKMFGFDAYGSFVNIYSEFNINPDFKKGFFDNTVLKYMDSSNKKTTEYWEEVRPIPLRDEEVKDYERKDSLEQARKDPRYLDSLDRIQNKVTVGNILLTGTTINKRKSRSTYSFNSLLQAISYNTVEGLAVELNGTYSKRLDTILFSRKSFFLRPNIRYGFSNQHFNADLTGGYTFGKKYNSITVSGGKKVFQFNNANPVNPLLNSISTLYYTRNYLKIYEAWFARVSYARELGEGLRWNIGLNFQDRMPLENTTNYKWKTHNDRTFTPNYPVELMTENFKRHQAFIATTSLSWQPGAKYIEFPDRKMSMGSKMPVFSVGYTQAFANVFGSDVKYSKWGMSISDDFSMKLLGAVSYRVAIGGFLNKDSVNVQDYTHFNGNQFIFAGPYMNTFQLASFYEYSNTERFYSTAHLEYHLNGFLTNKIPGFRQLNWYFVTGANAFYVNQKTNYLEAFVGIENIFKILRIDFIQSWSYGHHPNYGIRIGLRGAFAN